MNKILIACIAAASFSGFAHAATVQPQQQFGQPITVSAGGDMPSMLSQLSDEVKMLRTEVQALGNLEGQGAGATHYVFAAGEEGSPVSAGG